MNNFERSSPIFKKLRKDYNFQQMNLNNTALSE